MSINQFSGGPVDLKKSTDEIYDSKKKQSRNNIVEETVKSICSSRENTPGLVGQEMRSAGTSLTSTPRHISLPFSLEKKEFNTPHSVSQSGTPFIKGVGLVTLEKRGVVGDDGSSCCASVNLQSPNLQKSNEFVTVPFSPPVKTFSIDQKNQSNSDLPYYMPEGIDKDIKSYQNNSSDSEYSIGGATRFGGLSREIPLDEDGSSGQPAPYGRVTSQVPTDNLNYNVLNTQNNNNVNVGEQQVNMVEVNINGDNAAINDGADVPVAVPRRRTSPQDIASIIAMLIICVIIIGCCVIFFVI